MSRVMIFIDAQNFYNCVCDTLGDDRNGRNIDYPKLVEELIGDRDLIRVYFYDALPPSRNQSGKQRFLDYIEALPYFRVVLGNVVRRDPGPDDFCPHCKKKLTPRYEQKGVDVRLAIDMVKLAIGNTFDVAILISGDSDFVDAVQLVQDHGKQVELAFMRENCARELRDTCDTARLFNREFMRDYLLD